MILKLYRLEIPIRLVKMNTAIILAGGTGQRVGGDIPKQFLTVDEIPILAYTLSVFQNNQDIDQIVVVCVKDWEEEVFRYKEEYGISKLSRVIPGGSNSMGSISNGVMDIQDMMHEDDIAVIHDSVRPLITSEIISDCIEVARLNGNGCASIPMQETIVRTDDRVSGKVNIDRSNIMRVQTPQAYRYGALKGLYTKAAEMGITDSVYTNTLMLELGGTIYFSKGSTINIKITTPDDLRLFKALLNHYSVSVQKRS